MAGPLAPFTDAFALELRRRGYTPLSAVAQLRQVARLSRWLEDRQLGAGCLTRGRVEEFWVSPRIVETSLK
ncbi:hypothetical protein GCM10011372_36770 [Agromyces bauzanensis]|uniref:Integrase n=1 Tax=Agromyces bauzanensis TaxID=1308924 RepID=A0A917UY65_9MICO|nr:hypothetical protein GCM10011372_36770 [Agromyces bauzanensis]